MNTPRQPNVRAGIAPYLAQSQNVVAPLAPRSSFVAPVAPDWTSAAAETSGHLAGDTSASSQAQRCDSHNPGLQSS